MRLVRIDDPVDGLAIELHPLVTVVSGLSSGARERMIRAATAIPAGSDPGTPGSVEVHGVLLDLNEETLGLLELDQPLDVVIRANELPGHGSDEPEAAPEPAPVPEPMSEELDAARRVTANTGAALDEARRIRAGAAEGHDRLATRRRAFDAEIESARRDLDPDAAAALHGARAEFESAEAAAASAQQAQHHDARAAATQRITALVEQTDALSSELTRLRATDAAPVRAAVERVRSIEPAPLVPSPEARRLADELSRVGERITLSQGQASVGRNQLLELTARRDAAYDVFVETERKLRTPQLDSSVVEQLEEIHDQLFELDHKGSRLSSSRNRRRLLELKEEEDGLLLDLGFDTWTNYVMGVSSEGAEAERMRRYEVAKATYEFAEDELARAAMVPREDEHDVPTLEQRQAELLARAAALLGRPSSDPIPELRALLVPPIGDADPVRVATDELRAALEAVGVEVTVNEPDAVQRLALGWLGEAEAAALYITEIEADQARLTAEIAQQEELLAHLEAHPAAGNETAELAAARSRLAEIGGRAERHERAIASLTSLEEELGSVTARALQLRAVVEEADRTITRTEAEVTAARHEVARLEQVAREKVLATVGAPSEPSAADSRGRAARSARAERESHERDRGALEWHVLARMAQQRSVSFVGSVPLIIDDAFGNWPYEELSEVLERINRMSDVIQVVILTDDVDIAHWARGLGRDRALVVDLATASV